MICLSERLEKIYQLVMRGTVAADIGTDHALLPIKLLQGGICERVIASDIIDGPLESASKNIERYNLGDKIKLIKSDGLINVAPLCPETVIIAGMGGETICKILSDTNYPILHRPLLILQPMTKVSCLRRYLMEKGYSILSESVISEQNHFYIIFKALYSDTQKHYFTPGGDFEVVYELGGIMPKDGKNCRAYLMNKHNALQRATTEIEKGGALTSEAADKISAFKKTMSEIERRLKEE